MVLFVNLVLFVKIYTCSNCWIVLRFVELFFSFFILFSFFSSFRNKPKVIAEKWSKRWVLKRIIYGYVQVFQFFTWHFLTIIPLANIILKTSFISFYLFVILFYNSIDSTLDFVKHISSWIGSFLNAKSKSWKAVRKSQIVATLQTHIISRSHVIFAMFYFPTNTLPICVNICLDSWIYTLRRDFISSTMFNTEQNTGKIVN